MNDYVSGFWGYYVGGISLAGILWCVWLLWTQRAWLGKRPPNTAENTGHEWDGVAELNNPVPRWWTWMYLLMCIFGIGYLVLYPGLGSYGGYLQHTQAKEVQDALAAEADRVRPIYAKFGAMDVTEIAKDPDAMAIGQRLFLNTCAQCHGSDARGSTGFPNLANDDWQYGGDPDTIVQTITYGRHGIMAPLGDVIDGATAVDIANYVRSLSGLAHDQLRAVRGERAFMETCVACHGADAKGNQLLGAPNLTDDVWIFGSSEAKIVEAIQNGRTNRMPAHEKILTPEQIKILAAWVWSRPDNPVPPVAQQ